jgi:hypothetical protein
MLDIVEDENFDLGHFASIWVVVWDKNLKDSEQSSVEWSDLRTAIQEATRNLRENQPFAVHFLHKIAEPKLRSRKGEITIRKSCPRENVSPNLTR